MKIKSGPIQDMNSLLREKDRLKMVTAQRRTEMENQFMYFKHNYHSLLWNAVNPFNDPESTLSRLAGTVKNAVLPAIVTAKFNTGNGQQQSLTDLAALLAARLIEKIATRKKSAANPE